MGEGSVEKGTTPPRTGEGFDFNGTMFSEAAHAEIHKSLGGGGTPLFARPILVLSLSLFIHS